MATNAIGPGEERGDDGVTPREKRKREERTREILRQIRRIEVRVRRKVNTVFAGAYHSSYRGRGMEFDEFKEYTPGDDVRAIDWNVTARTGRPWVRRYREERELTALLLFDASASQEFGSAGRLKSSVAAEAAAVLAFSAAQNGDKTALVRFTDRIESYLPPKKGRPQALRVLRDILFAPVKSKGTSVDAGLEFVERTQKKRAAVFILSDLLSPPFMDRLTRCARRHDVTVLRLTDPREEELPSVGLLEFRDAETGENRLVDTGDKKWVGRFRDIHRAAGGKWEKDLARIGVDYLPLRTDGSHLDDLVKFFHRKSMAHRSGPAVAGIAFAEH
jgi:uncharacterized protein (DUF58 family)